MKRLTTALIGTAWLAGLTACMDLKEEVISGLTPGAYGSREVFEAMVVATYAPLRSFYAQERGFTLKIGRASCRERV